MDKGQPVLGALVLVAALGELGCALALLISNTGSTVGSCCVPQDCNPLRTSVPLQVGHSNLCDMSLYQAEEMGCGSAVGDMLKCGLTDSHRCVEDDVKSAMGDLRLIAGSAMAGGIVVVAVAVALCRNAKQFLCSAITIAAMITIPVFVIGIQGVKTLTVQPFDLSNDTAGVTFGDLGSSQCPLEGQQPLRFHWATDITVAKYLALVIMCITGSFICGGILLGTAEISRLLRGSRGSGSRGCCGGCRWWSALWTNDSEVEDESSRLFV